MTKREVEMLVERLKRIRVFEHFISGAQWHRLPDGSFHLDITPEVSVAFYIMHLGPPNALLIWRNCELSCQEGEVEAQCVYLAKNPDEDGSPFLSEFADEWMPFFRRGCWLSGCDIEATAHEKAEWTQDFTREELKAWSLKF